MRYIVKAVKITGVILGVVILLLLLGTYTGVVDATDVPDRSEECDQS